MSYKQGAVKLCIKPKFWHFLASLSGEEVKSPDDAADVLRRLCGITSRKDLDTDPAARKAYAQLIRQFNDHLNSKGIAQ